MPQAHVFRDLKGRTESKTRESAALQRTKWDERPSPPSDTSKFNKYGWNYEVKLLKTCHKRMFSGTWKDGLSRRRGSPRLCSERSETKDQVPLPTPENLTNMVEIMKLDYWKHATSACFQGLDIYSNLRFLATYTLLLFYLLILLLWIYTVFVILYLKLSRHLYYFHQVLANF